MSGEVALLGAVARFLDGDVRAGLTDPGLVFRVRIAANLLQQLVAEAQHGEALDRAEREALAALLGESPPADDTLPRLRRRLMVGLRDGSVPDAALDALAATLLQISAARATLRNPRFEVQKGADERAV